MYTKRIIFVYRFLIGSESLEEIVFNVSTGKLKSMIGRSDLSSSINLCKEYSCILNSNGKSEI